MSNSPSKTFVPKGGGNLTTWEDWNVITLKLFSAFSMP